MISPLPFQRAQTTRDAVEAIAACVFTWLEGRCQIDRDDAFGNVYERTWSDEITQLLVERGYCATHQVRYPASRQTCDVVCDLPCGKKLWVEIKGAWLTSQHHTDSCGRVSFLKNGVFRKHLLHPSESALKDLTVKLPLVVSDVIVGATLLIGYDSYGCAMDTAIEELIQQASLDKQPWVQMYREWQNPFDGRYRIRCWFWYQ